MSDAARADSGPDGAAVHVAARFEPPPDVVNHPGELSLSPRRPWPLEPLAIAVTFQLALGAPFSPLLAALASLCAGLAWWRLLCARETASARVAWDAWGITHDAAGDRVAIAWSSARASIEREGEHTAVQLSDPEGRTITCASARGWRRALSSERCWTSEASMRSLLGAVARLPRIERVEPERTLSAAPLAPAISMIAAFIAAALVFVAGGDATARLGATMALMLVLAIATTPVLAELVSTARRALSLRGARATMVSGSAGGPLLIEGEGGVRATLQHDGVLRDARLGERGEAVWLRSSEDARAGAPYRGRDQVRGLAVETRGERSARRRRAAAAVARLGVVLAGASAVAVAATVTPPRPRIEGASQVETTLDTRDVLATTPARPAPVAAPSEEPVLTPEQAQARSDAARARALARLEDRRAVEAWRDRGPHYEWVVECEPGGCRHMPYAVDPERGVRLHCVSERLVECVRLVGRPPVRGER